MKNKKGFTLVELLAVIAILAILVIIALPNVINMYTKAQKEAFLTETKKLYSEAEKKYISSSISGNTNTIINSDDDSKLDMTGEKLKYCILLYNNGKVKDLKVSNGKWIASLDNSKTIEELTIDDLEEGNLNDYDCKGNQVLSPAPVYCTFDGEMVQGAEYVNGQYTYRYMQEGDYAWRGLTWTNIGEDGWGVQLSDKESIDPVTSKLCTYINNKPVTSMSRMFYNSKAMTLDLSNFNTTNVTTMRWMFSNSAATTIDLSNFDTSNVTDMSSMFGSSAATTLDLSSFNTSNVTNMSSMFNCSNAKTIDLSGFDTSKVTKMSSMFNQSAVTTLDLSNFDTSNVTVMNCMFQESAATTLDLSSFDTSKVTDMHYMFNNSKATTLDLSSFNTSKVTNMSMMFRDSAATTLDLSSFDTSNVTKMGYMFYGSAAITLDLSSFDTSNVTDKRYMFKNSAATTGYARTQKDANYFNSSTNKPSGLNFIVK